MQKQAAGLAVYPDLAKIAPGALASIQNTLKDEIELGAAAVSGTDLLHEASAEKDEQSFLKHSASKTTTKVDLQNPMDQFQLIAGKSAQMAQQAARDQKNLNLNLQVSEAPGAALLNVDQQPSLQADPNSFTNLTNFNGIQYITVVDERNRRGRPPKEKKPSAPGGLVTAANAGGSGLPVLSSPTWPQSAVLGG